MVDSSLFRYSLLLCTSHVVHILLSLCDSSASFMQIMCTQMDLICHTNKTAFHPLSLSPSLSFCPYFFLFFALHFSTCTLLLLPLFRFLGVYFSSSPFILIHICIGNIYFHPLHPPPFSFFFSFIEIWPLLHKQHLEPPTEMKFDLSLTLACHLVAPFPKSIHLSLVATQMNLSKFNCTN